MYFLFRRYGAIQINTIIIIRTCISQRQDSNTEIIDRIGVFIRLSSIYYFRFVLGEQSCFYLDSNLVFYLEQSCFS